MLVIRGAYIRGAYFRGGAYIQDFTVFLHLSKMFSFCKKRRHSLDLVYIIRNFLAKGSKMRMLFLVVFE